MESSYKMRGVRDFQVEEGKEPLSISQCLRRPRAVKRSLVRDVQHNDAYGQIVRYKWHGPSLSSKRMDLEGSTTVARAAPL